MTDSRARLLAPAVLIVMAVSLHIGASPASAQQESPRAVAATAHALDELANACAQRRSECPPTSTPTPTATPSIEPTATPSATPIPPTPRPVDPSPTPVPVLPVPPLGSNPVGGYLRPSAVDTLLEMALRQGRWDVDLGVGACGLLAPWSNVWMLTLQDGLVVLAGKEYFAELDETLTCPLLGAGFYRSDVPCAQDEDGRCDVVADGGYWDALGEQPVAEPTDEPTPEAQPTDVPATAATPRVVTRTVQSPPQIVYRDSPPPPPEVVQVVTTVIVYAPTATAAPKASATSTVVPTATPTPTPVPTATVEPEASPTPEATPASAQGTMAFGGIGLGLAGLAGFAAMLWQRNRGERED